ncbi:MAG TPA: aminotransferase class I/II-fold pyridoxal phosphate-dependent enzyme [Magnetococcales bacterium]|nr:aminotransferase class I/II-fold pyridoxal phosphate-dependent enzyme [Magnetococcales bacterium]
MIPLAVPNLSGNEANYLQECIASGFVSSVGPFVGRFEQMVAAAAGSPFAVATASGTAGLHVALVALGVGPGDLVLVPSLTFIASANAVSYCGARPWLVDCDPDTWHMDVGLLEQILKEECDTRCGRVICKKTGQRVAAIMPVHILGDPVDMDRVVALAGHFGLPVVADAAAALGAIYRGRQVGDLGADLTVFSFNGNKTVTCGGGGAVVGMREDLLKHVRHLSTTARIGEAYDHDQVGFNYRLTNIQAAVGCAQLERLDHLVARKRWIRDFYGRAFENLDKVSLFPRSVHGQSAAWFSGVVLKDKSVSSSASLRNFLRQQGVEAKPFWKPLHLQEPYRNVPATRQTVSENVWHRIVVLPCSTTVTDLELEQVVDWVYRGVMAS